MRKRNGSIITCLGREISREGAVGETEGVGKIEGVGEGQWGGGGVGGGF